MRDGPICNRSPPKCAPCVKRSPSSALSRVWAERWSNALAKQWMAEEPEWCRGLLRRWSCAGLSWKTHRSASALYCSRTALFARRRPITGSMRWTDGLSSWSVAPSIPGLLSALREQIVPRLKAEVPNQPSPRATGSRPALKPLYHRLRPRRLLAAFLRADERAAHRDTYLSQIPWRALAGAGISNPPGQPGQRGTSQHGTGRTRRPTLQWSMGARGSPPLGKRTPSSILSTDYRSDLTRVAVAMFARWCQEIFFKYMRQHYGLDRLVRIRNQAIPDTTRVVNPAWRELDSQIRRQNGLLSRELAQFAEIQLPQEMEPKQVRSL